MSMYLYVYILYVCECVFGSGRLVIAVMPVFAGGRRNKPERPEEANVKASLFTVVFYCFGFYGRLVTASRNREDEGGGSPLLQDDNHLLLAYK